MDTFATSTPAVTLTIDLQNLIRSLAGANEYSMYVSSRLLKPFVRYHGNKICPNERTDRCGGRKSENIMLSLTLSDDNGTCTVRFKSVCHLL